MMERDWSSPFGGRGISAAAIAAEKGVRTRQRALRERAGEGASNEGHVGDKWQLLRALTVSRAVFGVSDRTLSVLSALLSFHPGKGLEGSAPAIVFPSNAELSVRSHGMAPATLRRHLASLVEAGLILRRDSPNGKRYRRTADAPGAEGESFGFDLSPLALLASRIFAEQERSEARARQARKLRAAITLVRRDTAKVIEAAIEEGREGPFLDMNVRLAEMQLPSRSQDFETDRLQVLLDALTRLCAEAENAYLSSLSEEEMSANESETERHQLNSNPDAFESNGHRQNARSTPRAPETRGGPEPVDPPSRAAARQRFDLGTVVRLCPDIVDYAGGSIGSLADLLRAAETARSALGISPCAYQQARDAMGEGAAAVVIAAILQRATRIRSPGGYLRRLSERALNGEFTLAPMLRALEPDGSSS